MVDIKFIRDNKEIIVETLQKKHREVDVDALIALDDQRLALLKATEDLRAEQNKMNDSIAGQMDTDKKKEMIAAMSVVKDDFKKQEEQLREVMATWQGMMLKIPNIPSVDTPDGPDDSGNQVVREWGTKPEFSFTPKEHFELGKALGIIDTETAAEVASSRFAYLKGDLVLMQFALIQMCLGVLTNEETLKNIANVSGINLDPTSFIPVIPPVFIRPLVQVKMARYMGPEDHYVFPNDDLMLIGSAEHTLGSMHMNKIFEESDLNENIGINLQTGDILQINYKEYEFIMRLY